MTVHHIDPTREGCSVVGCEEPGPYNETVWEHPGEDKKLVEDTIRLGPLHSKALVEGKLWQTGDAPSEESWPKATESAGTIEPRQLAEGEKLQEATPTGVRVVGTPIEASELSTFPSDEGVDLGTETELPAGSDAVDVAEEASFEETPEFLSGARRRLVNAAEKASALMLHLATGVVTDEDLAEMRKALDRAVGSAYVYTPQEGEASSSIDKGPAFVIHVLSPGQDVYQWQLRMSWDQDNRVVYTCPSGFRSRADAINNGVDAVAWSMERWAEMFRQASG